MSRLLLVGSSVPRGVVIEMDMVIEIMDLKVFVLDAVSRLLLVGSSVPRDVVIEMDMVMEIMDLKVFVLDAQVQSKMSQDLIQKWQERMAVG